ncbi:MAG: hypothetical protein JXA73_16455 [Acidobacteria bacterium]|nr:hypothetical protein [Acidobacteriota bacterium]
MSGIGILNEKPLHAALKEWYSRPGDRFEVAVDGFVVDIVRGDLLIEIQTGNFSSIRRKIRALASSHNLRLVYPIAREKWILRPAASGSGNVLSRRRSPKRGGMEQLFSELVSFPELMASDGFSLEVLFIREEEVRSNNAARRWRRRGWTTKERRLLDVVDRIIFKEPKDLLCFIPPGLKEPWTTADFSAATGRPRWMTQKIVYCLRESGVAEAVGKRGNAILYQSLYR